jgi:small subunit ribosomal protein S8e
MRFLLLSVGGTRNMAVWHGDMRKKKPTGGKKRSYRGKRNFEKGSFPIETVLGDFKTKKEKGFGGNKKTRLISTNWVNVSDISKGKTEKVKIIRVLSNPANSDYDRKGVITKGAILETPLGKARVTSKPGRSGLLNAILL